MLVTCAIILSDNKILITQRSEKMSQPLKWEFPGGKVKPNEKYTDCIVREIREELNIRITIQEQLPDFIYNYPDFTITLIPFVCNYNGDNITLSEHKDYKWVTKTELETFDWAPADIGIVEYLSSSY